jgi:hypothetical protein
MIAIDPPVRILIFSLASEGPSTHAPRRIDTADLNRCRDLGATLAAGLAAGIL